MIAAGITLFAAPFVGAIVVTVKLLGWKHASALWAGAVAVTGAIVAGSWLIALGVTQ